jgi:hypothetical protein
MIPWTVLEKGTPNEQFMNVLFSTIANSAIEDGKIDKQEWDAVTPPPKWFAKGATGRPWREPMWRVLAEDNAEVTWANFNAKWVEAVAAAYTQMGATKADVKGTKWAGAFGYETELALCEKCEKVGLLQNGNVAIMKIMKDGELDQQHFERVIFTAMLYYAMNERHNNALSSAEVHKAAGEDASKLFAQELGKKTTIFGFYYFLEHVKAWRS